MFIKYFGLITAILQVVYIATSAVDGGIEVNSLKVLDLFLKDQEEGVVTDSTNDYAQKDELAVRETFTEIFNVRCFWITGWNVYDISGLRKSGGDNDWSFIASNSVIYYNFCQDVKKTCDTSSSPSQMIAFPSSQACHRMAGTSDKFSAFSLLNKSDIYGGLQIQLPEGDACEDGNGNYTVTYKIKCNKTMSKGVIEFENEKSFNSKNCQNELIGQSYHACPLINYYIVSYFFNEYKIFFGGFLIVIGLFLIILGAKFVKATIFVVGGAVCTTIASVLYFNIFNAESTTTVWIVMSVGFVIGIILSWFLMKLTNTFFMLLGGYMGYALGIFLYNLFLRYINSNPKVVFWVTIGGSIILCALIALWMVKHALIFATSICGGYAVIRGASFYFGHFPNESIILDLIQNKEYEELDQAFDGLVYVYLGAWIVAAASGILWQYKINSDKSNDDYRKMN